MQPDPTEDLKIWGTISYTRSFDRTSFASYLAKIESRGAKASPCPLVSPALLLSGQKKTSRPTFLRHLTYMDIKVAASGLSDHPTWSLNLFEFVFAIQLESFLCTFNSCITPAVIIKVATAISLPASTDSNQFWSRNKVR